MPLKHKLVTRKQKYFVVNNAFEFNYFLFLINWIHKI